MYINKLRYYCYKVLPLVYDDSLSYYELLNKVVFKLNEVIDLVNVSSENVYKAVSDILTEWKNDGTLEAIINEQLFDSLEMNMKAGRTATVKQMFQSYYPYPTSSGARSDVLPAGTSAYYVQGFCKTPTGFAFVRLAPDENKANEADISQIFRLANDGSYIDSTAVDVHHGNGMVYYDGYLYVDVGSNVAKIDFDTMTIVSYIGLGGSCPALDAENGIIYSIDSSAGQLYTYDIGTGAIGSKQLAAGTPAVYNGSFFKDGIFYGLTYMNDLVMISVEDASFIGGTHILDTDADLIRLLEIEDLDVDPDTGAVYLIANQSQFSTDCYESTGGDHLTLRRAGFYIGRLFLGGGASSDVGVSKHIHVHATDIYVANDATDADDQDAKFENGTAAHPFRSFAAASYMDTDVRIVNADDYDVMRGGDVYQPVKYANYALISNLSIDTDFPLAIKGWTGYIRGGVINITDYGITLAYCDIASVDITLDNALKNFIGVLYNGKAEIIPSLDDPTTAVYMKITSAEINGSNIIPVGAATTDHIKYTNQSGTNGASVTLTLPLIGGARGSRLGLLNTSGSKYVIYNNYGNKLYGTDGTSVDVTIDRSTGEVTFTAPFTFDRVDVF